MKPTKAQLENEYNVPVYTGWHLVPPHLHARTWYFKTHKVAIPDDAKPDAIKGGGGTTGGKGYYFLFDENKFLPEELRTVIDEPVIERPKLRVNYE